MKNLGNLLRFPLTRLIVVMCLCIFICACGADNPVTPPDDTPQPLKYQKESEQLALYTTGTLHPQDWLVKQIDHELDLIRSTWGDSIPIVNMTFRPPLDGGVSVRVSQVGRNP